MCEGPLLSVSGSAGAFLCIAPYQMKRACVGDFPAGPITGCPDFTAGLPSFAFARGARYDA
eukprot:3288455-Lingulodinium_polyedra.AAC.1